MKRIIIIAIIICVVKTVGHAQNAIAICVGGGINKIVSPAPKTSIGNTRYLGISIDIKKDLKRIRFLPSLLFCDNDYVSPLEQKIVFRLRQRTINLNVLGGVAIGKKIVFKAGFCTHLLFSSMSRVEYGRLFGISGDYGADELYAFYFPQKLQAGIIVAISKSLGKLERACLDIQLQQNAVSILHANYFINYLGVNEAVFAEKSLPTYLTLGLSIKLIKRKKNTNQEIQ